MCPKRFLNFVNRADLNKPLDMSTGRSCSWCEVMITASGAVNLSDSDQSNKSFCSEKCFESSRRASFKRTKMCDWCDKMSTSENGVKSGSEYSSTSRASLKSDSLDLVDGRPVTSIDHLQFCNDSCLNSYKQTYFVKETAEVLQVKKEKTVAPQGELKSLKSHIVVHHSPSILKSNTTPKQIYKSPKIIRSISIPKFQKAAKRLNSTTPSLMQKVNNIGHHNSNPIFSPHNVPNFSLPIPASTDAIKIPSSTPIYIPIPIPIPIPIFKNAPEILEILHQYGYKQSIFSSSADTKVNPSPAYPHKPTKSLPTVTTEPQTEALDLSGSCDPKSNLVRSTMSMNLSASFPIASILQMNDPYLKRRNRILDAPPSSVIGNLNHQMAAVKNFNINYSDLLTSTQLKAGKYSKRKVDRNGLLQRSTVHQPQSPKQVVQTAKTLLRRYPLISLRRNIKSAPSSVLDSNNKLKNISD